MNCAENTNEKMEQQRVNVALQDTTGITCDECGHSVFEEGLMIRKVSQFLTGTSQPGMIPIPVFACKKCGHVNQEFLPKELKNLN